MADRSGIEWCEATWNPIVGCSPVSPGCQYCYAARMAHRLGANPRTPQYKDLTRVWANLWMGGPPCHPRPEFRSNLRLVESTLDLPLRWRKPRRIFVCSMGDLFHETALDQWIRLVFGAMLLARQHTFLVLTKRPARMQSFMVKRPECFPHPLPWPLPNVWLGVSCEDQPRLSRLDILRQVPAAKHFVSFEPLLEPISLAAYRQPAQYHDWVEAEGGFSMPGIDWVIVGGESGGPPERALVAHVDTMSTHELAVVDGSWQEDSSWAPKPEALEWVRSIRDQCVEAGVSFTFKGWGGPTVKSGGGLLDWRTWDEAP